MAAVWDENARLASRMAACVKQRAHPDTLREPRHVTWHVAGAAVRAACRGAAGVVEESFSSHACTERFERYKAKLRSQDP